MLAWGWPIFRMDRMGGGSSQHLLLCLQRMCEEAGFQNYFSTNTKILFLLHEVVSDSEDYLWNLLNMQILPPLWVPLCVLPPSWNVCGVPTVWSPWYRHQWLEASKQHRAFTAYRQSQRSEWRISHTGQQPSLWGGRHSMPHPPTSLAPALHTAQTLSAARRENLNRQSQPDGSWFRGAWHEHTQDLWFLLVGS